MFQPLLTNQHPDILSFILPRLAFLGRSLADGHVPLWNPFHFAGAPYAADPQSGWLYLTPMLLFSSFSPGVAMRAFIVWNPVLAGLGMYAFLRLERLSRTAATVAGLSIALALATSSVAISLPFAGAIAWTTVVLVGAAGYVRTRRLSRRVAWLALAAFGWGQVASAHMSHGLAMCTVLTGGYLIAHAVWDARATDRSGWRAAGSVVVFFAVLGLANLAIFLPRLDYIARSSLGGGYEGLADPLGQGRLAERPIMTNGVWSGWPFALGASPGAYVGALVLLCVPAALRTRRHRALLVGFGAVGLLAYLATLNALVTAEWFRSFVLQLPFGDVYLHNPGRLRYLAYVVVPPIGALGLQTLIDRPLPWRRALRWLLAGLALWLVVPLVVGADPVRFLLLAVGAAIAIPVVLAVSQRRRWALVALPVVLALELAGSAVYSQVYSGGTIYLGLEAPDRPNLVPGPLRAPEVATQEFLDPGELGRFLAGRPERYLTWVRPAAYYVKGYLWTQESTDWPSMVNERGTLFGARDVLGYNPVQPAGYWSYVRATNRLYTFYNASVINEPSLEDVRLLGVRYLIVAEGQSPSVPGRLVRSADGYDLYEVVGWEPLASVVADVRVVDGPDRVPAGGPDRRVRSANARGRRARSGSGACHVSGRDRRVRDDPGGNPRGRAASRERRARRTGRDPDELGPGLECNRRRPSDDGDAHRSLPARGRRARGRPRGPTGVPRPADRSRSGRLRDRVDRATGRGRRSDDRRTPSTPGGRLARPVSRPTAELGLDQGVEISVEDPAGVPDLQVRPVVLDHLVRR